MVRRQRALIAVETAVAQAEYEKLSGLDVQLWGHPVYLPVANTSDHQAQIVLKKLKQFISIKLNRFGQPLPALEHGPPINRRQNTLF